MVPLSMTSDLWPGFQGHDIYEIEYLRKKTARLKHKVTIIQELLYYT